MIMADQVDMIKLVVREMLMEELNFDVERNPDPESESFTIYLTLGGKRIPDAYVVLSLDAKIYADDIDFEVV